MSEETPTHFSSTLPIIVYSRPVSEEVDWQEFDRGPGYFTVPAGQEIRVRIKSISDAELVAVVSELQNVPTLRFLDLSENRNITNSGLVRLKGLPQLTGLNLSSCSITSTGLEALRDLPHLAYLDLSYCNRLSDQALKSLEAMRSLTFVSLKSCLGISKAALSRIRRKNLTIYMG